MSILEKKLKAVKLGDSGKQTLGSQLEELFGKFDKISAEGLRLIKPEDCIDGIASLSNIRSCYRDLIKL